MNIAAKELTARKAFRIANDKRWANQTAIAVYVAPGQAVTRIDYDVPQNHGIAPIRATMNVPSLTTITVL